MTNWRWITISERRKLNFSSSLVLNNLHGVFVRFKVHTMQCLWKLHVESLSKCISRFLKTILLRKSRLVTCSDKHMNGSYDFLSTNEQYISEALRWWYHQQRRWSKHWIDDRIADMLKTERKKRIILILESINLRSLVSRQLCSTPFGESSVYFYTHQPIRSWNDCKI